MTTHESSSKRHFGFQRQAGSQRSQRVRRAVIASVLTLAAHLWGCGLEDSFPAPANSREEALERIETWKVAILRSAGAGAIELGSLQWTRPGDVWIQCEGKLSSRTDSALSAHLKPEDLPRMREAPVSSERANFEWRREFSSKAEGGLEFNTGLKIVDVGLRAAFEQTNAAAVQIELSINDPRLVEFESPSTVYQEFSDSVGPEGTPGNTFVTGVIEGLVRMAYSLLDEKGEQIELSVNLATEINELPQVNASYVDEETTTAFQGGVTESGERRTVFAAITRNIESGLVQTQAVQDVCGIGVGDDLGSRYRIFTVRDSGLSVLEVAIEESAGKHPVWFLEARNISGEAISGSVILNVRNPYGGLVDRFERITGFTSAFPLLPGETVRWRELVSSISLQDATIELEFERD